MSYDSTVVTMAHISSVRAKLEEVVKHLRLRELHHDQSKLEEPEKTHLDAWTPELQSLRYANADQTGLSQEYQNALAGMGEFLQHHYANNKHHPEHWPDGINDMSLIDVIEMLCDWAAAVKRHDDGDLSVSIKVNCGRFKIDPQLGLILANTAQDLGWIEHE